MRNSAKVAFIVAALSLFSFVSQADSVPRYTLETVDGEKTVKDGITGLTWQQQPSSGAGVSWKDALTFCEQLQFAGQDGWRLPNVSELLSIVDEKKKTEPAVNTAFFAGFDLSPGFWSSTTSRTISTGAYVVYFTEMNSTVGRGGVSIVSKTSKMTALCVK